MTPKPAAHTPTPWTVAENGTLIRSSQTDELIGRANILKADAAFIVRSTNNFENMLAALKYVVESGESYERVQEIAQHAIDEATK